MSIQLSPADWWRCWRIFCHCRCWPLVAPSPPCPTCTNTLVNQHHWLLEQQFNAAIALAQAAPGPNVLFVALLGWNVGLNAGGGPIGGGGTGLGLRLLGMVDGHVGHPVAQHHPDLHASRWGQQNRELRADTRAFKQGMAPVVVALLIATGWILTVNLGQSLAQWPLWLLTLVSTVLVWRTRLHLLWLLGAGGLLGWFGLV